MQAEPRITTTISKPPVVRTSSTEPMRHPGRRIDALLDELLIHKANSPSDFYVWYNLLRTLYVEVAHLMDEEENAHYNARFQLLREQQRRRDCRLSSRFPELAEDTEIEIKRFIRKAIGEIPDTKGGRI